LLQGYEILKKRMMINSNNLTLINLTLEQYVKYEQCLMRESVLRTGIKS